MLFRAYCYIRSQGPDGLKRVAEHAVLNANYLHAAGQGRLSGPATAIAACTSSSPRPGRSPSERGIRAMDIAKRLIDFNFHAPTVYFPLIVPEALMIEPTETESRETLEAFARVLARDRRRGPGAPARRPTFDARSAGPTRSRRRELPY